MNEIQEMRGQIEEMQRTFNYRTERLERRLEMALDSKQVTPVAVTSQQFSDTSSAQEVLLFIDEDENKEEEDYCTDWTAVPGSFPEPDQTEIDELMQDMRSWFGIIVRAPNFTQWLLILLICVWLCSVEVVDFGDLFANVALTMLGCMPMGIHLATEEDSAVEPTLT